MEQLGKLKLYTFDEVLDEQVGTCGTPERDEFERRVADSVQAYKLGEAVKEARKKENLTQAQLGERAGVGKAQISKVENGGRTSLPTISRVFRALGITSGTLDLGRHGRVALW